MPLLRLGCAFLLAVACGGLAYAADAQTLACAAETDFPPFAYRLAKPGGIPVVRGSAPELLDGILKRAGAAPLQLDFLPWPRCLKLVEYGKYAIAIDVPTAQVDPAPYLVSEPYAFVNSVYVYSTAMHPGGLKIDRADDLARYRSCGLMGYTFDTYGLDINKVDVGAGSYPQLLGKLLAGRCDLVLEKREVFNALPLLGDEMRSALSNPSLQMRPIPGEEPLGLHFIVSRRAHNAAALLREINAGIPHP